MDELVSECLSFGSVGEVAVGEAPFCDGVGHSRDDLAQRMLTLGSAGLPTEVFLRHDVRSVERPRGWELRVVLLERHRAVQEVGDASVAALPLHAFKRVNP